MYRGVFLFGLVWFRHNKQLLVIALQLLSITTGQTNDSRKVGVSVYYESLCPDSKKFINEQLHPVLTGNNGTLFNSVRLALIPYGKAKSQFSREDNEFKFICHHGPDECLGNRIHACGLQKIMNGQIDNKYVARNALDFVNCLMKVDSKKKPIDFKTEHCAHISNVTNFEDIEDCVNHNDGKEFLANYGTKTDDLSPPLTSVPTITFNDVHSLDESTQAYEDFKKVLLKQISAANDNIVPKPRNGDVNIVGTGLAVINIPCTCVVLISTIIAALGSLSFFN